MNVRLLGDDPVFVVRDRPASYSEETTAEGILKPAVLESPAQYTVNYPSRSPGVVPVALAALAAWMYFK